jgi:hypothetical protein
MGRPGIFTSACGENLLEAKVSMVLHRDIYWVGRQWAVTGYGLQACDQKQKGKFDIESARLWEDGVLEAMRELAWLNTEDFDKAIAVARTRYPLPSASSETIVVPPANRDPDPRETGVKALSPRETIPKASSLKENPAAQPKPPPQKFDMRVEGWPARFAPLWRVRIKR